MSKIARVKFSTVNTNEELLEYVVCNCNFCNKQSNVKIENYKSILKLGHERYYCSFCLRNNFNYKKRNSILLLDFKGIIGFYVNYLYQDDLWLSEIIEYIQLHSVEGMKNPVFSYDKETMTWFVDFDKVGNTKHKINLKQVIITINSIIDSFKLSKNSIHIDDKVLKEKYNKAVTEFFSFRKRPENKLILSPTLKDCISHFKYNGIDWENSKDFSIAYFSAIPVIEEFKEYQILTEDLKTKVLNEMIVNIKKKKIENEIFWEGIVKLPGLAKSKISSKEGKIYFETRNSLSAVARYTAKTLGLKLKFQDID